MSNVINLIAILYMLIIEIYVVKTISKKNIIYSLYNLLILIIIIFFYYINGKYNYSISKNIVYIFLYFIINYIFFKNTLYQTFILTIFYYIIGAFFEIFLSIILFSPYKDIIQFDSNYILKFLYTILVGLFLILVFKIPKLKKHIREFYYILENFNDKLILISMIIVLIAINMLNVNNARNISSINYFYSIILLIILVILEIILFKQYLKILLVEKNNEALLNFMIKYEKIIDNDKMNRHEMLNNLIILKSYRNEDINKFNETINMLIKKYDNNDLKYFNNVCDLPYGIKAVIYYKFYDMKDKGLNVNLLISKDSKKLLKSFDGDLYYLVSKILGILLDNASEASIKSNDKEISVDIYTENKMLIIEIANTTKNKVNLDLISKKHYSSKGKNRGLGLHIADIVIKKSNNKLDLEFNQINNTFIAKLSIKK
jgi:two-component system, LytTR family, sensor histidine kinase AgrC